MKTYHVNHYQYHVLPAMLCTTQRDISRRADIPYGIVCRRLQDGEFSVGHALRICNAFRLPLSLFISAEDNTSLVRATVDAVGFEHELVYNASALAERLREDGLTITDLVRTTGLVRKTVEGLFTQDTPLSRLAWVCGIFQWNLSDFINDPTLPLIAPERSNAEKVNHELVRENARLLAEVNKLKAEIKMLKSITSDSFTCNVAEPRKYKS